MKEMNMFLRFSRWNKRIGEKKINIFSPPRADEEPVMSVSIYSSSESLPHVHTSLLFQLKRKLIF